MPGCSRSRNRRVWQYLSTPVLLPRPFQSAGDASKDMGQALSYALEALELKGRGTAKRKPEVEPVLRAIREAEIREYPSVGKGTDIRLRGRGIVGAALVDNDDLLHLSVFATPAQTGSRSGSPVRAVEGAVFGMSRQSGSGWASFVCHPGRARS